MNAKKVKRLRSSIHYKQTVQEKSEREYAIVNKKSVELKPGKRTLYKEMKREASG